MLAQGVYEWVERDKHKMFSCKEMICEVFCQGSWTSNCLFPFNIA